MPPDLAAIRFWAVDLDNTLYSPHSSLFPQIHARMEDYIMRHFGIGAEAAAERRRDYFHKYGTSLRGMMIEENVAPDTFLDFVHDIDYSELAPQPELRLALERLPGRKVIFTNADRRHAGRVLHKLALENVFSEIFDIADGGYVCKPQAEPYKQLLENLGANAGACCMIDDMEANLKTAADLGMATLWLRHEADWLRHKPGPATDYPHCHYTTGDLAAFLKTRALSGDTP